MLFEAAALVFGIVEFAETVGDFHLSGEDFEALGPVRLVGLLLGERRDRCGEFVNDGRLHEMFFGRRFEQGRNIFPRGRVRIVGSVRVPGIEAIDELLHALAACEVAHLRRGARLLRPEFDDGFAHGHALPVRPVELLDDFFPVFHPGPL